MRLERLAQQFRDVAVVAIELRRRPVVALTPRDHFQPSTVSRPAAAPGRTVPPPTARPAWRWTASDTRGGSQTQGVAVVARVGELCRVRGPGRSDCGARRARPARENRRFLCGNCGRSGDNGGGLRQAKVEVRHAHTATNRGVGAAGPWSASAFGLPRPDLGPPGPDRQDRSADAGAAPVRPQAPPPPPRPPSSRNRRRSACRPAAAPSAPRPADAAVSLRVRVSLCQLRSGAGISHLHQERVPGGRPPRLGQEPGPRQRPVSSGRCRSRP